MQRVSATDFMIEEIFNLYEIKRKLVEQSVKRLLDVHLGKYIPEDGEIVGLWEPEELDSVARQIMLHMCKIETVIEEDEDDFEEYEVSE